MEIGSAAVAWPRSVPKRLRLLPAFTWMWTPGSTVSVAPAGAGKSPEMMWGLSAAVQVTWEEAVPAHAARMSREWAVRMGGLRYWSRRTREMDSRGDTATHATSVGEAYQELRKFLRGLGDVPINSDTALRTPVVDAEGVAAGRA